MNAAGTGPQSAESNAVAPVVVPGAPTNANASVGSSRATVSWAAPASDGGSPITNYVVTPFVNGVAQAPTTVGNITSATVTGLTNGTSYTFRVSAMSAVGAGPQSAASNTVTPKAPASVPPTPTPTCLVPNVVSKQLGTAKTKIKKAHCRVGTITYRPSTRAKTNRVLSETPKAGKRLKSGTKVNLTVGRGGRQ
jgi:predicted phage tail protein